jgi:phosphoglycolate phosphatase-like HAD superfamily hydrolase
LEDDGGLGDVGGAADYLFAGAGSVYAILLGLAGRPLGNVRNEKLLVTPRQIADWAVRYELNLFTGRNRKEFSFTFEKWEGTRHFLRVITMDDVKRIKPHPEGLLKILGKRDPASALYLGDNIDDALAARDAGVPFMAIIAAGEHGYRARARRFRESGALALLARATELNEWLRGERDEVMHRWANEITKRRAEEE